MEYIIDNATVLKERKWLEKSILIKNNHIASLDINGIKSRCLKMNIDSFILSPSYVLLNSQVPWIPSYQLFKKYMIEQFLLKGCTTLFTYVNVNSESELSQKLNEGKTALISSPIDFLIGLRIPLKLVTPSFIRKCKKEKIPGIFIEIEDGHEIQKLPWSWIREALFPYNCPLIPKLSDQIKHQSNYVLMKWKETMLKEKIPFIDIELTENMPLSAAIINKIGLYPRKSGFIHGSEVSYNLYFKSKEIKNVDTEQLFLYHKDRLVVTVHKGKVIRAGKEVLFTPGFGEYVKVKTPSFFSY